MIPTPLYLRPRFQTIIKRNSSFVTGTTATVDNDFTLLVSPNTRYIIRLSAYFSLGSRDFKYAFDVPSSPRLLLIKHWNNIATSSTPVFRALATEDIAEYSLGQVAYANVEAEVYLYSTVGGYFNFKYATNTTGGDVDCLSGSYMEYTII